MKILEYNAKTHEYLNENTYEFTNENNTGLFNKEENVLITFNSFKLMRAHCENVPPDSPVYYYAKQDNRYGLIDRTGKIILPFVYNNFIQIINGLAIVSKNRTYGAINLLGEILIPFAYKNLWFINKDYLMAKTKLNKLIIINHANEKICNKEFDNFDYVSSPYNDYIAACINNKWGFISQKGETIIDFKFANASFFQEGFAPVMNDEQKWGLINKKGELILPFKCNDWTDFTIDEKQVKVSTTKEIVLERTANNINYPTYCK